MTAFLASQSYAEHIMCEILKTEAVFDPTFNAFVDKWCDITLEDAPHNQTQSMWDIPLVMVRHQEVKNQLTGANLIRLSSISGKRGGGEWLNVVPIKSCGLLLNDREIQMNIGLRLGASIVTPHACKSCSTSVDSTGAHGLSCRMSRGRLSRHADANLIIMKALSSAGILSTLEPVGLMELLTYHGRETCLSHLISRV